MLGERLRELRFAKKESLFQVAEAVASSKAHIWDLERNRSKNPSLDLLRRIAAHFETTVDYLIEDANNDPSRADRFVMRNKHKLTSLSREDLHLVEKLVDRLANSNPILIDTGAFETPPD